MIEGGDEVVIRMNVTDILVLTSAGLSIIKSLLSVGTYSYFHVLLSLIELTCTVLALAIFVNEDFLGVDGTVPEFGSDDIYIFLLAFVSS